MPNYQCFKCSIVTPLVADDCSQCPSCGSSNGQIISDERLNEGLDSGAIFNIDPKTGKPQKKKKR